MSKNARSKLMERNEETKRQGICLENEKIFESINAAAKNYVISAGEISSTCNGERNTAGRLHWKFLKDWLVADEETRARWLEKSPHRRSKVHCIEMGEIFTSIREAARKYDIDHKNIRRACCKSTRTAGGFHWEFVQSWKNFSKV